MVHSGALCWEGSAAFEGGGATQAVQPRKKDPGAACQRSSLKPRWVSCSAFPTSSSTSTGMRSTPDSAGSSRSQKGFRGAGRALGLEVLPVEILSRSHCRIVSPTIQYKIFKGMYVAYSDRGHGFVLHVPAAPPDDQTAGIEPGSFRVRMHKDRRHRATGSQGRLGFWLGFCRGHHRSEWRQAQPQAITSSMRPWGHVRTFNRSGNMRKIRNCSTMLKTLDAFQLSTHEPTRHRRVFHRQR